MAKKGTTIKISGPDCAELAGRLLGMTIGSATAPSKEPAIATDDESLREHARGYGGTFDGRYIMIPESEYFLMMRDILTPGHDAGKRG